MEVPVKRLFTGFDDMNVQVVTGQLYKKRPRYDRGRF